MLTRSSKRIFNPMRYAGLKLHCSKICLAIKKSYDKDADKKYSNSKYPLLDPHYYSYKLKTSITDLNLHYLIIHKD